MPSLALHRSSLFLAACSLCLVAAGALQSGGVPLETYRLTGIVVAVLSMVLAGWLMMADGRRLLKGLAAALAIGSATSVVTGAYPAVQAVAAQFVFALTISIAVATSPSWLSGPQPVADEGVPSARTLAWLAAVGVAGQVALGAALRYDALPVWPHISGSLLVGGLLLFAGMAVLQSYAQHGALRRVGTALLCVTALQVTLGMAAYGVRMMAHPAAWASWLTLAHVVNGALTLGAAMAFALQVYYHVQESLLGREAAA